MYLTLWYLGSIVAAWTVFGTLGYKSNASWQIPVGVQAAMPAIQGLLIWIVPESPRWLLSKDRIDEARNILVKYHADGDESDQFVSAELYEIQETLRLEKENSKHGWTTFLRTPGNRKRLFLVLLTGFFSQCSGNGLVSYYIHDILNSIGIEDSYRQSLINGGLQLWSFFIAIGFSSFFVDRLGRKTLFLIAGFGMLASFTVWTGYAGDPARIY